MVTVSDALTIALIVLVALWGAVTLLAGVWALWADWSFERRERAVTFPAVWCERRVYDREHRAV